MKMTTAGLRHYLNRVGSHSVLSKEEEHALFQRLRDGDSTAREEIIRSNLRFVIRIAHQFAGRGLPLEDLIQEGSIGLIEVIDKFDHNRGFRFSTYAAFWIRQAIQQALRKQSSMIRLPVRKSRLLGTLNEIIWGFLHRNGREPSIGELSEMTGATEESMARLLKMRESVLSLDEPQDNGEAWGETVAQTDVPSAFDELSDHERRTKVGAVLGFLTEKERRVVRLRFGFDNGKSLSLRHTSRLVGLSQEGVRRVERKALGKLRRPALCAKVAGLL